MYVDIMLRCQSIFYRFSKPSCSSAYSLTRWMGHASHRRSSTTAGDDEYDYIVVGAGSAGCTIANRLVLNDTRTRVLVTEAGPAADQSVLVRMPSGFVKLMGNERFNWCHETVPQKNLNGRKVVCLRGKLLGGTSSVNGMFYIRGYADDYDRWAFAEGATGWSYAECLPYFIKSQKHELGASEYRGDSGHLYVSKGRRDNPLHKTFFEAGAQAGYPWTEDFNGTQQEGIGCYDFTIKHGQRASTAAMYLRPAMKAAGSRLTVLSDTMVGRVLFNGRRAVGVEYQSNGRRTPLRKAFATREVILSSGAINSPHLLLLSGIGPADVLKRHNIQVVHHSPGVGINLQDHLRTYVQYGCTKPVTLNNFKLPHKAIPATIQWLLTSTGPLSFFDMGGGCFLKSNRDVKHPDIQGNFIPGGDGDVKTVQEMAAMQLSVSHSFQLVMIALRMTSRGSVTLQSADPNDSPIIDPNYLDSEEDKVLMRSTVKLAREILNQPAFDEYRGVELKPGRDCKSDSELDAFIRANVETSFHFSGTCRMGSPDADVKVVVDTKCRVVGVEGLRVVDASVMPSLISGNTNAPTIMIAEKVADAILEKTPLQPAKNAR